MATWTTDSLVRYFYRDKMWMSPEDVKDALNAGEQAKAEIERLRAENAELAKASRDASNVNRLYREAIDLAGCPADKSQFEWMRQRLAEIAERERREKEDAEPIDCPWLCTLGFRFVKGTTETACGGWVLRLVDFEIDEERGLYGEELRLVSGGESGIWHIEVRSRAHDWSEGVGLAEYETRGQLLRLLEALGIERNGG